MLAVVLAASGSACVKAGPVPDEFGDPVGMAMEGSEGLPSWRITFRAKRPVDPNSLVPAVAGIGVAGVRACPSFVSGHRGRPIVLSVLLAAGKAKAQLLEGKGNGAECVAAAMDGRDADSRVTADLRVQVLVPHPR